MLTHVPVLFPTILQFLQLRPNDNVVDATLGGGGHARGLLEAIAPNGKLLGIEADGRTLKQTAADFRSFGSRFIPVHGNFRNLQRHLETYGFSPVQGILLDLGLSSIALNDRERGFSFQVDGPLDMRFDPDHEQLTAGQIVTRWSRSQLAQIFSDYGQEPLAEKIAEHIVAVRRTQPIATTQALAEAVTEVKRRRGRIHPVTQVFQALRIAVNDELGALRDVMPQGLQALEPGRRMAIITFHSLEDRLVKRWSHQAAEAGQLILVNKHVVVPSRVEQRLNPRSRSAKLRVVEKLSTS